MFIRLEQIKLALEKLESVHPFYGITFLVCKAANLPVGDTTEFSITEAEKRFLDQYYQPDKKSRSYYPYYRVFRISDKHQRWLTRHYRCASSPITRMRKFGSAFLFKPANNVGWAADYVETLNKYLSGKKPVPAFYLAVWLYRERKWPAKTAAKDIVARFLSDFSITPDEQLKLFDVSVPEGLDTNQLFQAKKISWAELQEITGKPPGAPPEEGGTLAYLEIAGVGPAKAPLALALAERLNLITGDNGLGKTFLLECAWWALTGRWAGFPAQPRQDAKANEPRITFQISGQSTKTEKVSIAYDWLSQKWPSPQDRPIIPGLLIYARADSSFAVWDPAREYAGRLILPSGVPEVPPRPFVFTQDQVWEGVRTQAGGQVMVYSNGLLQDWITWQNRPDRYPFGAFQQVLRRLSPRELGLLESGEPVRLAYDAREIPTLKLPYGKVPIIHAAAGIRRIVAAAYLIVWAWEDHKAQSELNHKEPQKRIVILVDEMESHLHPQWQRAILPALLGIREDLDPGLQVQFLIATHSPLVMASVEPVFDPQQDKLFHLDLAKSGLPGGGVRLDEQPFIRHGPVDSWLTSDVFELRHARSLQAEDAIEAAKALQQQDAPTPEDIRSVSEQLTRYLSAEDEFWPRWLYFAQSYGVRL